MTAPTLPVSGVVNVTVNMAPKAASTRNFGACLIVGSSDVIDVEERIRSYSDITEVAEDFGTSTPEYLAAVAFLAQNPKPSAVQIGRWSISPSSGVLRGRVLSQSEQTISNFTSITDGAMTIRIDGSEVTLSAVNLQDASNLDAVAEKVTAALQSKGTCQWDTTRFTIKSVSTGTTSTVGTVSSTPLSKALGLDAGTVSVGGIEKESLTDALATFMDFPTWYMAYVAALHTDEDVLAASALIEASNPGCIIGFTTSDTKEIDPASEDSLGAKLKALGNNRTMLMYSSTSQHACASVMGRMSTVNFEGSNTTITLKFKQCPGVAAENLRTSQGAALSGNNVNVFAAYNNDTSILQEGVMCGGWYIDEIHGLDWLQSRVQTDVWNLLYTSTTKVGQDETGIESLVSTVSRSLDQAVSNGLVAPGVWNGDAFGSLKKGDTLTTGYYVYVQPLEEQAQSEREARKAPPVQIAAKLKGAIHFVDVAITVNR